MLNRQLIAAVAPTVAQSARHWIFQLGGLGFIPLGLLDSSIFPLPGSMDVLTIVLSARHGELWSYYALMATVGSVLGGYVTYRLARKGGKETLARKFPRRKLEKIYKIFNRWGFGSIAIPALLPPPAPMVSNTICMYSSSSVRLRQFPRPAAAPDLGARQANVWRDRRRISQGDQFADIIDDGLKRAELLVVVMSPNWMQRPYCRKEFETFLSLRKAAGVTNSAARMLVVGKGYVDRCGRPLELQGQEGFLFYSRDDENDVGAITPFFNRGKCNDRFYGRSRGRIAKARNSNSERRADAASDDAADRANRHA